MKTLISMFAYVFYWMLVTASFLIAKLSGVDVSTYHWVGLLIYTVGTLIYIIYLRHKSIRRQSL